MQLAELGIEHSIGRTHSVPTLDVQIGTVGALVLSVNFPYISVQSGMYM